MSLEQATTEEITNTTITDQQVDKFFETGGEEAPKSENTAGESDKTQIDQKEGQKAEEDQTKEKVEKVVPYGALHEERERRKELQGQTQELNKKIQRMEEAFQKLIDNNQQKNEQTPNYDENPLEALRHEQKKLTEQLNQHNDYLNQKHQSEEYKEKQAQFVSKYQQSALEYLKENPDFREAYSFLLGSRANEYKEAGLTLEEIKERMMSDEFDVALRAYKDGVNPGERLFALARARGYKKSEPQISAAEEKLSQVEKGVQASKSISGAQGKNSNEMTLSALAQLDDDDLEDFIANNWNKVGKMMR